MSQELIQTECAACGESFMRLKNRAKYCPECMSLSAQRRRDMKAAREMALIEAVEQSTKKHVRYASFDLTGKSLRRVDAEAKLFGMSYGQYTAACYCGSIEQVLLMKGIKNPKKKLKELEVK